MEKTKPKFNPNEEFFIRYGALLLEKQISASQGKGIAIRIFTAEELNKATNNYDTSLIHSRILSTVYKGSLDGQIVAVKTPEGLQVSSHMLDYFLNQAVTQIQINHKNVVKLLGCCLETEIPIVVQEFIPNGNLSSHMTFNLLVTFSWSDRLRIANEIADAVSYLHCANSNPIIHRDIRSNNILFDEKYVAKLSNFGFSVVIPSGKTGTEFGVEGRYGYIDPEYIETSRLSEKCDVYSFGVVLLELMYWKVIETEPSIVSHFIAKMEAGCYGQILDGSFVGEPVQTRAYTTLALRCIKSKGEERPTMIEVAKELRRVRGIIY
ncbi:Wall-associated receptor kinase-like [Thalictrum thalictroides]|uniref:Wall-associated receptor kinase-like n=1 Tax=Thalictrum thalictroides TaxID=46969 RepID=A0A7J6W5D7_THATH|nr:Wall-associated receptor kinase-like [Thalictrum thalictroides]